MYTHPNEAVRYRFSSGCVLILFYEGRQGRFSFPNRAGFHVGRKLGGGIAQLANIERAVYAKRLMEVKHSCESGLLMSLNRGLAPCKNDLLNNVPS